MLQTLFTIEGRVGRGSWWLGQLCCTCLCIFGVAVVVGGNASGAGLIVVALCALAALWINLCVTVKRYHDLGKHGAWFAIVFVPFIGPIWQVTECGFVSGALENNNYGPPPGFAQSGAADELAGPGALANKEIDFSKYRLSEPVVVASAAGHQRSIPPAATKPTFGKRV